MATAVKHKQRSHRSYQENRKVLGSVAIAAMRRSDSKQYTKQAKKNWLDSFKQMFRMGQKGDR